MFTKMDPFGSYTAPVKPPTGERKMSADMWSDFSKEASDDEL